MIASKVASSGALSKIAQEWRMPTELATDLVKLSLYDVVLYVDGEYGSGSTIVQGLLLTRSIHSLFTLPSPSYHPSLLFILTSVGDSSTDSGSMAFEEGGERIDDLKALMGRVAYATSLFDQDGISVSLG
jgi:hypothetical protein